MFIVFCLVQRLMLPHTGACAPQPCPGDRPLLYHPFMKMGYTFARRAMVMSRPPQSAVAW